MGGGFVVSTMQDAIDSVMTVKGCAKSVRVIPYGAFRGHRDLPAIWQYCFPGLDKV